MIGKPLVDESHLGKPTAEYGWNRGRAKLLLWMWGFLLFPALLSSIVIVGLPLLGLSIYIIVRSLRRLSAGKVLFLHEHGFIDQRNRNKPTVISYDNVKSVRMATRKVRITLFWRMTFHICTVEMRDGTQLKYTDDWQKVEQISALFQERVTAYQLPYAIATFNQGVPIEFGSLQLHREGLSLGKKTLSWSELEKIELVPSRWGPCLSIDFKDGHREGKLRNWAWMNLGIVPNLQLFLTLIRQIQPTALATR